MITRLINPSHDLQFGNSLKGVEARPYEVQVNHGCISLEGVRIYYMGIIWGRQHMLGKGCGMLHEHSTYYPSNQLWTSNSLKGVEGSTVLIGEPLLV